MDGSQIAHVNGHEGVAADIRMAAQFGLSRVVDLSKIKTVVLDIDDTSYHYNTGIHPAIKTKICDVANAMPELDSLKEKWAAAGELKDAKKITPDDLGKVAPLIVGHFREMGIGPLIDYVYEVHNVDRSKIAAQPEFVSSVRALRNMGVDVVVYTNGPWGKFGTREMHANDVLNRIGFDNDFDEQHIVDLLKTDRNPRLCTQFNKDGLNLAPADVFRKPTKDGFVRAMETLNIKPDSDGGYSHVLYLDDGVYNFEHVKALGVNGLIVGVNDTPYETHKGSEHGIAKVWHNICDEADRCFSIAGDVLHEIADQMQALARSSIMMPAPRTVTVTAGAKNRL